MKVSLQESKLRQRDHKERCEAAARSGQRFVSVENEDKSYLRLFNELPKRETTTRVLDVGCQLGEAYRRVLSGMDYFGLEVLEEVAEQAMSLGVPNVSVGFMEEMVAIYKDNSFDVVWARHVLEHSTDINIVLQQIKTVLKPDGVLAFIVPCGFHNEPAHISKFEKDGWIKVFTDNGFEITKSWQHDFNLNEFCGIARKV